MVLILPQEPSKLEGILQSLGQGLSGIAQGGQALKGALNDRQTRNTLAGRFGEEFRNIRDPESRKQMLAGSLQKERDTLGSQSDLERMKKEYELKENLERSLLQEKAKMEELSLPDYQMVEERFGKEFADLYRSAPTGGKTELLKVGLEALLRGENIRDIFNKHEMSSVQEKINQEPLEEDGVEHFKSPVSIKEKIPEKNQFPEYQLPIGSKIPKEVESYKKDLRRENAEIFKDNISKQKALNSEKSHLKILNSLSKKVPDGIGRVFINKHGEIRPFAQILKLVPPEAERFVKTVNDFITGAKDIFGARVTNFDLQSFKSRLPSLINSGKGRQQIIRQMEIFNEIEGDYHDALKKVYQHYGMDNIRQEDAEKIAEGLIAEKEKKLREELDHIGEEVFDLSEMPNAMENANRIIEDDQGNRYRSNGNSWEPL